MSVLARATKWASILCAGSMLFTGSCLADNFWATLWGDTIITGTVAAVWDVMLGNVLPQ